MKRWLRQNIPRERLSLDLVASDMREMWQSVLSYRHRGCDCAAELWLLAYCSLFCDWKRKLAHDHLSFEVIHLLRSNYCTACFFLKKGIQILMTSNVFIEKLTRTLIQFTVAGLRSFPVCEKQNHRPFCISSCTSYPCCSQRWVGEICLCKRLPCWTSIRHHPKGQCHEAAEMSYTLGRCHRQSLYIKDLFSVPVHLLSLGLSHPGHGSHRSLKVNTNQNGIFPWEKRDLTQGLESASALSRVLNERVGSWPNAGACCMTWSSNSHHTFPKSRRSLSHEVFW